MPPSEMTATSLVPPPEITPSEVEGLAAQMDRPDRGDEKRMLSKALQVEVETSAFYRRMVAEISQLGDNQIRNIGLVVMRYVRYAHPVAVQVAGRNFLNTGQRL